MMNPYLISRNSSYCLLLFFILSNIIFNVEAETGTDLKTESSDLAALAEQVTKFSLENGLRIIVVERPEAPVFNAQLWVKVGSVDESQGKSGAAHLLEHMAFKGTTVIGTHDYERERDLLKKEDQIVQNTKLNGEKEDSLKELEEIHEELEKVWNNGEYTKLLEQRGAKGLNAATSADYTMYTVNLPSSELEFWFYMESERILRPVFRQFYKELQVVLEERRMRTEDNPSGRLYEALLASAYWGHPYQAPTIGWKNDLINLTREDAKALHHTFYRPDNMVVVIVGNVEPNKVKDYSQKYFGRLKKPEDNLDNLRVVPTVQSGERHVFVEYEAQPEFLLGYHKPTFPDPESAHLSLLYSLLDEGRSSPFQKILIQEKKLATSIYTTEAPGERYDPLFIIGGTPAPGVSTNQLISEIDSILDSLEISSQMLESAKKRIKVHVLNGISRNSGLATYLGQRELLHDNWKAVFEELDQIEKTNLNDVKLAMKKYLIKSNRTIVQIKSADRK